MLKIKRKRNNQIDDDALKILGDHISSCKNLQKTVLSLQ